MMKILMTVCGAVIFLSGCVNNYYYQVQDDKLHIYFNEPKAGEVFFLSSLDQFSPHETIKNKRGIWEITVPSGLSFEYFFIVDGTFSIPTCDQRQKDDFGFENCIYIPED